MGQGQGRLVLEAGQKLASPAALTKSDLELFPLFYTIPFTRKDSFTEIPAKVLIDIRRSNPHKFALLILFVRLIFSFLCICDVFNTILSKSCYFSHPMIYSSMMNAKPMNI